MFEYDKPKIFNDFVDVTKCNIHIKQFLIEIKHETINELIFYFLNFKLKTLTKNKIDIINLNKDDINFAIIDDSLIISIYKLIFKYKNEYITIKQFKGKINFNYREIKIQIIEKGKISHEHSFFKNILLKLGFNLIKGIGLI